MSLVLITIGQAVLLAFTIAGPAQDWSKNPSNILIHQQLKSNPAASPPATPATSPPASPEISHKPDRQADASSEVPPARETPQKSTAPEPKEFFSQLALFLFGSGIAFFIALLAWSDQIRGIDKDIRELENRFLEVTGIQKWMFLRIVKPQSPDDRGVAILEIVQEGRITNKNSAEVLAVFTKWNQQWSGIERLSAAKYYLTITLTIVLFVMGSFSLLISPGQRILTVPVDALVLVPPALIVASLLTIMICLAKRENSLRLLLGLVSDMV